MPKRARRASPSDEDDDVSCSPLLLRCALAACTDPPQGDEREQWCRACVRRLAVVPGHRCLHQGNAGVRCAHCAGNRHRCEDVSTVRSPVPRALLTRSAPGRSCGDRRRLLPPGGGSVCRGSRGPCKYSHRPRTACAPLTPRRSTRLPPAGPSVPSTSTVVLPPPPPPPLPRLARAPVAPRTSGPTGRPRTMFLVRFPGPS